MGSGFLPSKEEEGALRRGVGLIEGGKMGSCLRRNKGGGAPPGSPIRGGMWHVRDEILHYAPASFRMTCRYRGRGREMGPRLREDTGGGGGLGDFCGGGGLVAVEFVGEGLVVGVGEVGIPVEDAGGFVAGVD